MSENGFPVAPGTGNQEGSNLPTTTDASEASSSELESTDTGTAVNTSLPEKHSAIKSFFKDGEMVRRLVILVFLVIFVAGIIFAVISFTSTSTKAPDTERKLGQYSSAEIGNVLDFLDTEGFKYKLSNNNTIIVDASEYSEITEQMLRKGIALPQESTDEGDQIIMTDSGFGVSQRMENERIKHSREVQLARAIERIDGISHATVLLAIPKDNVFAREKSRPSAAVVVTLKPNTYLSPENVNSIRFLVASSVHNLLSKDVTVTDHNGRQLSAEVKGLGSPIRPNGGCGSSGRRWTCRPAPRRACRQELAMT